MRKPQINSSSAIIFLCLYYIACLLFHENVEKPFEWFVAKFGVAKLSIGMNVFFIVGSMTVAFILFKRIRKITIPLVLGWLFLWVVMICLFGYYFLMPYKSEGIHFIQYALMAILTLFIFRNAWQALNFSFLLGIIDEGHQYVMGNSFYFDFNDVILNFGGSGLGVMLFLFLLNGPIKKESTPHRWQNWLVYMVILFIILIFSGMYFAGQLCVYPEDGCVWSLHKLENGRFNPAFFDQTYFGKYWHRVKELEGVILIVMLPLTLIPLIHYRSNR